MRVIAALGLVVVLSACGVGAQSDAHVFAPTEVPFGLSAATTTAPPSTSSSGFTPFAGTESTPVAYDLYFIRSGILVAVTRRAPPVLSAADLVMVLVAGPSPVEVAAGRHTVDNRRHESLGVEAVFGHIVVDGRHHLVEAGRAQRLHRNDVRELARGGQHRQLGPVVVPRRGLQRHGDVGIFGVDHVGQVLPHRRVGIAAGPHLPGERDGVVGRGGRKGHAAAEQQPGGKSCEFVHDVVLLKTIFFVAKFAPYSPLAPGISYPSASTRSPARPRRAS